MRGDDTGLDSRKAVPLESHPPETRLKGQIRIRSNVCTRPDAWHLVPGDRLKECDIAPHQITDKQRDEMMYYEPCCICHRTIFEILEDGCDHPVCRQQGITSRAEAERKKVMVAAGEAGSDTTAGPEQTSSGIRQPPK